ncbi:molybdenum cofactor biosynthesis protein [Paenibacillus mucilaginosus]|uniref:Molybdopterin synthase catalytic subunit n=2 Tax=Paenibacillus mucilaginosus TaxID=61624 RepID=H6N9U2_9BACL|nr:molybdenum cofactor biosynthesis protein MoaE [Paenibacillus mucilaginosus]AEI39745.1 molybdopterin converting factor-like protein [Paenibacillus mucilaginosus KNP414]AFC28470.1 molybdopterin converting factor-like protein [Paenibacillus mucilaginosus 3016]MCG7217398.1 molybdenum cofactor biosynthesis protein MoaE [Paenibacillus mucilaginosus]WDM29031.1 molybdenum cofactor biosynthesis protein MoaE [Paenibacillus mucilaginosus]WFA17266.1 molybdopterin converting factor [Paenibacillus mucila
MKLKLLLFAGLAESLGAPVLELDITPAGIRPGELKLLVAGLYPEAAAQLQAAFVAVNQAYADETVLITPGDEVALIPPVSGGEAPRMIITRDPISVEDVTAKVIRPHHGAALSFVGTTREFTHGQRTTLLEYEGYEPMALKTMEQIGGEIEARWPGTLCAITHRLGPVPIGEISVVIAVSSPHRDASYDASRYAIERLKQIVPIWKKEIWEDGSEWKGHQQGPWNPLTAPAEEGSAS